MPVSKTQRRRNAVKANNRLYRKSCKKLRRQQRERADRAKFGQTGKPTPVTVRKLDEPDRVYRSGAIASAYELYLGSPAWRRLRTDALQRDKYRCVRCGFPQKLQVHHLTYDRVGEELLEDLVTLCAGCHRHVHRDKVA